MKTICINGSPLTSEKITGIERYMIEIIKRIDLEMDPTKIKITIVYPKDHKKPFLNLTNIFQVGLQEHGNKVSIRALKNFLNKENAVYCSLSGNLCIQRNSIICIHDIRPWIYSNFDPLMFRLKCAINFLSSKFLASRIVTVSETSKAEISQYLHVRPSKISVISNGWEHTKAVGNDNSFWENHPEITKKDYYYSLGSQAPHKNFGWVIKNATNNPNVNFVIAGKLWGSEDHSGSLPPNVKYLGYVSEKVNKELMINCKAFLFPSFYEGFGIPPLEALSFGADIVVSNASCLPEIFSQVATIMDPHDYHFDFQSIRHYEESQRSKILQKYTWKRAATQWLELFYND